MKYTTIASLVISILSFSISLLTYNRSSPSKQLIRTQDEKMRVVAMRAVVVFDQLTTISIAQLGNQPIEGDYLFVSYKKNIERLEASLDEAIGLGLFDEIVGTRKNALAMHTAFRQSMVWMSTLDPQKAPIENWTKLHFVMGIVRLVDQSLNYRVKIYPPEVETEISGKIAKLKEQAWTYLENSPKN